MPSSRLVLAIAISIQLQRAGGYQDQATRPPVLGCRVWKFKTQSAWLEYPFEITSYLARVLPEIASFGDREKSRSGRLTGLPYHRITVSPDHWITGPHLLIPQLMPPGRRDQPVIWVWAAVSREDHLP